jgi:hypothetical protein
MPKTAVEATQMQTLKLPLGIETSTLKKSASIPGNREESAGSSEAQ